MAEIVLKHIHKQFEKKTIIDDLNLTIKNGSFTILLGPSGCGKTTTLRMIAGLEKSDGGEIWIGDRCVSNVSPGERDVAMVFQNYALYPTMTIRENIEFGLINNKVPKHERKERVEEIIETVGLKEYWNKKPGVLSGGQRQRVALARAMVKKPKVFLMDEPLSNLDAKLRTQMRTELVELHQQLGATFVYVTHDQMEAMSMGEDIVVMQGGEVQQKGSPMRVYNQPENLFTAQFIGTPPMNIVEIGCFASLKHDQLSSAHCAGFRPEKVVLSPQNRDDGLTIQGMITSRQTFGAETIYQLQTDIGVIFARDFSTPIETISMVELFVAHRDLHFFDKKEQRVQTTFNVCDRKEPLLRKG